MFSQFGQDEAILALHPEPGTFLEIGASDGIFLSDTYLLELHGWRGLCVEPNPEEYKRLAQLRRCATENVACANVRGQLPFQIVSNRGWSGLIDYPHEFNQPQIEKELVMKVIDVPVLPLQELLDKHGLNDLDYFSLDVEGAELSVLQSIDWERAKPHIITVEINSDPSPIPEYLNHRGYVYVQTLGSDQLYRLP